MRTEVLLASGYSAVLLLCAGLLEWMARHVGERAHRYRTAGFTYHPHHDLWVCPENEPLWPYEVDRQHRLIRYRARPTVCNACPAKTDCTDSHSGREIARAVDPWPHSEVGRFHRGISVALAVFAAAFLGAAAIAYHRPTELLLEAGALAVAVTVGISWAIDFVRTPTGFPEVDVRRSVAGSGDATAAATRGSANPAAAVPVDLVPPSRRGPGPAWGFNERRPGTRYRRDRDRSVEGNDQ